MQANNRDTIRVLRPLTTCNWLQVRSLPEVAGFPADLPPPRFEIQIVSPGRDTIGVQLPTPEGMRYGYIRPTWWRSSARIIPMRW